MAWTDERVELLKRLWMEGRTASQIAQELGEITRNAVIGKAHRLGLSGRPSPVRAEVRPAGASALAERAKAPRMAQAVPARATLLTITDRMCKWPIGHPGEPEFHFCGQRTHPGHTYCAEHTARAYQPLPARRERLGRVAGQ